MKRRLLSFLLMLVMLLSLVPAAVFADEEPTADPVSEATAEPAEETAVEPDAETAEPSTEKIAVYALGAYSDSMLGGIPAKGDPGTGTTKWGVKDGYLCSGNMGKSYSSSTLTLTMTGDALIRFEYKVSCEAKYDTFSITHNSITILSGVSGETGWVAYEIDAKTGDKIQFTYKKDGSGDAGDDCVYLRNFSAGEPVIVSFDANGGEGEMAEQKFYGAAVLNANTFTKDHGVFIGWAETPDGEVKYADAQQIDKPESALTLYAVWAEAWVISFTDADSSVNVKKGEPLGEGNVPEVSKTGYIFGGWYNGSEALDPSAAVTGDVSYSARWTPISYIVRFDANGGTGVMNDMRLAYDQSAALPKSIFVRSGYTFSGWSMSGTHYADEEEIRNLSEKDGAVVTFKAEWAGCRVPVRVDPNYAGSTVIERTGVVGENYNYIYNESDGSAKFVQITDPTRDGYKFSGWYSESEGGSEITNQYKFTADDAENGITLYAHWVEAATVTFDANGGSCYTKARIVVKGDTIGYLPSASRSGLNFDGWYTEPDGGEKISTDTRIYEDTTIYAHYRKDSYYVRFNANKGSGTMADVLYEFDRDYKLPECEFTREDYAFAGWSESSWSSSVKYKDGAVINREFDDWDSEDGEIYTLYAVWKETVFGTAFKAIEAKLPTGNTVRSTGSLNLPVSGTGWSAVYESDNEALISGGAVIALPESGSTAVTVKVTVTDTTAGESKSREYVLTLLSEEAVKAEATLKNAVSALPYSLTPKYGIDTNAADAVSALLEAKGYGDVTVTVKEGVESYDGFASVEADGKINYYFNPAMTGRGSYLYVSFVLSLNGASAEKRMYTNITWDLGRAREALAAELDRVSVPKEITVGELDTLPRYSVKEGVDPADIDYGSNADLNTWAVMTWTSSNSQYLKVGPAPSYPVYSPYAVTVLPGAHAVTVTLTVTMKANSIDGLSISKVFKVLVKPADEDPREVLSRQLGEKLDAALEDPGLRDFVTGEKLDNDNVVNDIRFPTTRDIGVDGKYQPVTITSSNENVIETPDVNNAAHAYVYRPLPGEEPEDVTMTITITDKETGVTASRDITVTVRPLTDEEIAEETALMEQVKAHYFDGIKNANIKPDEIKYDLEPFTEAYLKDGKLTWAYSYDTMTGRGIVPVAMDDWEVEESWRTFRSSNARVITHENLLVTREKEHRVVTVTSWLSSETLGKYAEKYPNDARFAALYKQPVTAELVVLGTDPSTDKPTETKLKASFTLSDNGSVWFSESFIDLTDGTTVFDVFGRALADNGYTSEGGRFVTGISGPNGTLRNKDRGEYSGWMYSVNGRVPGVVMSEYYISDGDRIAFFYTDDYREINGESKYTPEEVIKLIDAIGTVDKSSGDKISAARTAYDGLNDADKGKVTNRSTLFAAEKTYAELIRGSAERFTDIYKTTGDYIQAMDEADICRFGGEWPVFGLARSERELPELYAKYYEAVESYVEENIDADGRLDAKRVTDNARLIIALSALDKDVTDVAGHDLLAALADLDYVKSQGLSGVIYTLLALDSCGYDIPAAPDGAERTTREELVRFILDKQLKDGGWAFSGDTAESDMTAMALQALAAYYAEEPETDDEKAIKSAVDKAISCLSAMQTSVGGFTSGGVVTPESGAQVITALTALGIDPDTDSRFVKNGISVLDSLCSFYVDGGGFRHTADGELDEIATAQSYYALAAYWRFGESKTPLYDMSDLDHTAAKAA